MVLQIVLRLAPVVAGLLLATAILTLGIRNWQFDICSFLFLIVFECIVSAIYDNKNGKDWYYKQTDNKNRRR